MKIALVQMDSAWENKEENLARAELFIAEAARRGCAVAVLPELFSTGFSFAVDAIAERRNGETFQRLRASALSHGINIVAGFSVRTRRRGRGRNAAVVIDRTGACIADYTKTHPFSFGGENRFYVSGTRRAFFTLDARLPASVFICYDLRFPELFRQVARRAGAFFVIANWPEARILHWKALLQARAIENQCYCIGVNRVGTDGHALNYPGASMIFDPLGSQVCCGSEREELIVADISPDSVPAVRREYPFLQDMHTRRVRAHTPPG